MSYASVFLAIDVYSCKIQNLLLVGPIIAAILVLLVDFVKHPPEDRLLGIRGLHILEKEEDESNSSSSSNKQASSKSEVSFKSSISSSHDFV